MKKTLIAVAALAATGAFAQVSVYGRLDAGYAQTKSTNIAINAGTGAATYSAGNYRKNNGVESHNSASSMWGIQGSEDLGGGMKAFFKLEQDVYTANGNTGASGAGGGAANLSGFNRTSLVGVSGGFGSVAFGRDYVPFFKLIGATDINSLSRISTVQRSAASGYSTTGQQIVYTSPNLSGFVGSLAVIADDNSTNTATAKEGATNATIQYMNGPLMVGVGFANKKVTATTTETKTSATVLAGSYDLGVVRLVGNYISDKVTQTAATDIKQTELNIGAIMPMGKVTLRAQVGRNNYEEGAVDRSGTDMVLGAEYALSAKTALFAKTGTFDKNRLGDDAKVQSTAVGVRTVF
jgi:predicted porin